MEIEYAKYTDLEGELTVKTCQLMRTTCPKCHRVVEFIIDEDDRLYKKDAEFYENEAIRLKREVLRLNQIIGKILSK